MRRKKSKRQAAFADQLPDVLQLVTSALRSGYGVTETLESVAEETEEPPRASSPTYSSRHGSVGDLSDAMRSLGQRMDNQDLEWVVSAIDINRGTGGNLSEVLENGELDDPGAPAMARQVRTLTAEGRLSARILDRVAVPDGAAGSGGRSRRGSHLRSHGGGLVAPVLGGLLMILGRLWVRKLVNSITL